MAESRVAAPRAISWEGTTRSPHETRQLAARMASAARPGDRVGLVGELGAGKTEFARGFARGMGVTSVVTSPSFTLMQEYAGRLPLFHIDVYRLDGSADVIAGGLLDERQDDGVSLIEWADRLEGPLAVLDVVVRIDGGAGETRRIRVETTGESGARFVDAARGGP